MFIARAAIVCLIVGLFAPSSALAQKGKADQFVFVGLLPTNEKGTGELRLLAEAQSMRSLAEAALADVSRQPVFGHTDIQKTLGKKYLVDWFRCAGSLTCIIKLLAPLRNSGFEVAVTGEVVTTADMVKVQLTSFTIADGKTLKQASIDIPLAEAKSPAKWREAVTPLISVRTGDVKVVKNLADATCTVDGQPCSFGADGQTLALPPGQHTIELTKDGYLPEQVVVTVKAGVDQEVAIALKPAQADTTTEPGRAVGKVGAGRRTPTLTAIRIDSPPSIDGKLDDASWQKAWLETNFTQKFPDENKPPTERTELRVLYDDEAIYVAVRAYDSKPQQIQARLTRRDRNIDADKVVVDISSKNDKASSYSFQVNAAGVQLDGVRYGDTSFGTEWDGRWYAETRRDEQGWIAELKIPLVTLRYNGDVTSFGFQVRRIIGRTGEIQEWAYIPQDAQGEVSQYGTLDGITGLNAKRLFQVLAYDSRRIRYRRRQGIYDGTDTGGNIGADVKIGLTPALTLDATVNPDFGTVEVDQVVLNLTTVEVYFPEKRPYFIEGADLFATPFTLFYSRRVGLQPPEPLIGTRVEPLPDGRVWTSMKLTGLLAPRLTIGLFDAVTSRQDVLVERSAGDPPEEVMIEPLTNFSVLRLRQEFGNNSWIGLLATSVNRFEEKNAATPMMGDLCPLPTTTTITFLAPPLPRNGRCFNDAYTGGIDLVLKTADAQWGASAQVVGSMVQNGPTRSIPDGTQVADGDTGIGVMSEFGRYGGGNWLFRAGYNNASPKLSINDTGFLELANFHQAFGNVTYRETTPSGIFLNKRFLIGLSHKRDWKLKDNIGTSPELSTSLMFTNFWNLTMGTEIFPAYVENRETLDGARTERPPGAYGYFKLTTDNRKSTVVSIGQSALKLLGDKLSVQSKLTLTLRPTPTLEIDLIPTYTLSLNGNRWWDTVDNMDGTRTYYFTRLDASSLDLTLRSTYTFTRKLSVQAYVQPFIAGGHRRKVVSQTVSGATPKLRIDDFAADSTPVSDFRRGALNVNLFLRWEYLPLSTLWLVYTRSQGQTPYDMTEGDGRLRLYPFKEGPATDVFLAKLSYLWY